MKSTRLAKKVRLNCLDMVYNSKASHVGSALSVVDIITVLYNDIIKVFPNNPNDSSRDRFILSKGHATVALYSLLAEVGFIDKNILSKYGSDGSILMNHVHLSLLTA